MDCGRTKEVIKKGYTGGELGMLYVEHLAKPREKCISMISVCSKVSVIGWVL